MIKYFCIIKNVFNPRNLLIHPEVRDEWAIDDNFAIIGHFCHLNIDLGFIHIRPFIGTLRVLSRLIFNLLHARWRGWTHGEFFFRGSFIFINWVRYIVCIFRLRREVSLRSAIWIVFGHGPIALAANIRERWIKFKCTIDVRATARIILLNIIIVNRT